MEERMNGWMDGWMDQRMNEWMDVQLDERWPFVKLRLTPEYINRYGD